APARIRSPGPLLVAAHSLVGAARVAGRRGSLLRRLGGLGGPDGGGRLRPGPGGNGAIPGGGAGAAGRGERRRFRPRTQTEGNDDPEANAGPPRFVAGSGGRGRTGPGG